MWDELCSTLGPAASLAGGPGAVPAAVPVGAPVGAPGVIRVAVPGTGPAVGPALGRVVDLAAARASPATAPDKNNNFVVYIEI